MSRQEGLPTMAVIGEMYVPDPAGLVIEVKIIDEIGLAGPHMGTVEGLVQVSFVNEFDHLFGPGKDVLIGFEFTGPGHVFNGNQNLSPTDLLLKIVDPVDPAPESDLKPGP